MSWEIPNPTGKPKAAGRSSTDVLRSIPDDLLIAECHRRGLTVGPPMLDYDSIKAMAKTQQQTGAIIYSRYLR